MQQRNSNDLIAELEAGLRIDEHALDEALQVQSELYYKCAKALALMVSRRDAAKQALAETEAEVDLIIRRRVPPKVEGKKPPTEKEIEVQRRLHKDVKEATEKYLKLNARVGQFTALKEAVQQRGYVLKSLVELHIAGYYGDSVAGSATNQHKDHSAAQARAEMHEMRKRGRDDGT